MGALSDMLNDLDFGNFIQDLISGGWYSYVFPFLLVYSVVFTIINKAEIFQGNKATRVIIAFVFAAFAVVFPISDGPCDSHLPTITSGCSLGDFLVSLFPGVTAFTMGILALYIVAAMLGVDLMSLLGSSEGDKGIVRYILGGLGLLVVVYYYGNGLGWWGSGDYGAFDWLIGPGGLLRDPLLYILIVFGLLFFWVSGDDEGAGKGSGGVEVKVGGNKD